MKEVLSFEVREMPGKISIDWNNKAHWVWNGLPPETVKIVNPALEAEINEIVAAKVKEYLDELAIEEKKKEEENGEDKINREAYLTETLEKAGLKYVKDRRGTYNRLGRYNGYDIDTAKYTTMLEPKNERVWASGEIFGDKEIEVAGVHIEGRFTLEQFKRIAEKVKEIAEENK